MQEPTVDLGDVKDLIEGNTPFDRLIDHEQAFVRLFVQAIDDLLCGHGHEFLVIEGRHGNFRAAHGFHDRLFEGRTDRHDFARRLHARAQFALGV